ncbi:hypothetical protein [Muribaculum intestinale]|uniref:hypothetical protein n=1 Tax=Muribaculum intestinale TaxID=1796646 RepID=UPI000FFF3399|nr:hypothetical protein [Muribaculum intestinale]RXE67288.1 hypothetical protein ED388_00765 [Muribaculaceae bacterium Isolate-007 (NCI)]
MPAHIHSHTIHLRAATDPPGYKESHSYLPHTPIIPQHCFIPQQIHRATESYIHNSPRQRIAPMGRPQR